MSSTTITGEGGYAYSTGVGMDIVGMGCLM